MQSKQWIAGGSSIPPAQKPPPQRSAQELARELRQAEDLVQGNPAKIAKHLRSLIHDPLRAVTREFNSSQDITERQRLHQHRLGLVMCHIRAEAALLLGGIPEAVRSQREAKIDAPLKGVEEKLATERSNWKGDQAGFNRHFASLITHRDALALMAKQADKKLQTKEPALYQAGLKASTVARRTWETLRTASSALFTLRNSGRAAAGIAAGGLASVIAMTAPGFLSKAFSEKASPQEDALVTAISAQPEARFAPHREVTGLIISSPSPEPDKKLKPPARQTAKAELMPEPKSEAVPSRKPKPVVSAERELQQAPAKPHIERAQTADLRMTLSASIAEWATSNTDKRYRMGSNNSRFMDCSQFIMGGLRAARDKIEGLHNVRLDINGLQTISAQITKVMANAGGYLSGTNITHSKIEPGMIIGVDSGSRGWDVNRWKGIDHIAITYREPSTGDLYVAESTSEKDPVAKKTGVRTMPFSAWLNQASKRGYRMIVTDVLSLAKDRGSGEKVVARLSNPAPEKDRSEGSYRYAVYHTPAHDTAAHTATATPAARHRRIETTFNGYSAVSVSWTETSVREPSREVSQQAHSGISQSEREQALTWSREQIQQEGATSSQPQPQM